MLKILKTIAKIIFLLPMTAVAVILLFMLIPAGQKIFLTSAIHLFNDYSDYQIVLNNFNGNLLSDFTIDEFSLSQGSDGALYTAKDISVIWQIQSVFEQKIHIEKLKIKSLLIANNATATESKPDEKTPPSFLIEDFIAPIIIENLQVAIETNNKIFLVNGDVDLSSQIIHLAVSDEHDKAIFGLNTRAAQERIEFSLSFAEEKPYLLEEIYPVDLAYYPIRSKIEGDFSFNSESSESGLQKYHFNITSEDTEIYQEQFKFEASAYITENAQLDIEQMKIFYNGGKAILKGGYADNNLALEAHIHKFPTPAFVYNEVDVSRGFLDSHFKIDGNLFDPIISGSIAYKASLKDAKRSFSSPVQADGHFSLKEKNLSFNAGLKLNKKNALDIKVSTHLSNFPSFEPHQPLNAKVAVKSRLENFPPVFNKYPYTLKGILNADLVLLGSYQQPKVTGNMSIDADLKNFTVPSFSYRDVEILPGVADAKIIAKGNIFNPQINIAMKYRSELSKNDSFAASAINATVVAIVSDKQLNVEAAVNANDRPTLEVFAQSDWASLVSFNQNKALNGKIRLKSSLDNLSQVFNKKSYRVAGTLDTNLQLSGNYDAPKIFGDMRVLNASYHDQNAVVHIDNTDVYAIIEDTNKVLLKKCKATINDGKFVAKGYYSPEAQQLDFSLQGASTSILKFLPIAILDGSISAKGKISGSAAQPIMDINTKVENFYIENDNLLNRAFDFNMDLSLKDNIFTAHSMLDGYKGKLSEVSFQSNWNDIVDFNLSKKFSAKIKSKTDLGAISQLLILDKREFHGALDTVLSLEGTLERPKLFGSFNISKGDFEDKKLGMRLKNIDLRAVANGDKIHIHKLLIQDNAKGKAQFNGVIDLNGDAFSIASNGTLNKMKLFDSDKYQGVVDGHLKLNGALLSPVLSGGLDFTELSIKVPDSFQSSIPEINVVTKRDFEKSLKKKSRFEMMLNLGVDFDKRAFIRGRGLDAELGGKLQITGSHAQPIFHGKLQVLKGKYLFLNKKFVITKGNLQVDKDDVYLDFRGEAKVNSLTAIVEVTGSPEKAKIKVSSIPVLPEDEIIAKILFGHEIKKLTPIQAVRLASTLNSLNNIQNRGGNLDLLDKTRSMLKFDQLEVNSSDKQPFSIGAGKYLFDKVYVGGQQGPTLQDSKLSIQIEATDNITIESSGGPGTSGNDVKVFWKKDY